MRALLETIGDAFLGVLAFFANLSVPRYDDPALVEYKRRKIACVVATGCMFTLLLVTLFVSVQLDTVMASKTLSAVFEGLRAPLAYGLGALWVASTLYVAYAYYALWRFMNEVGGFGG